MVGNTHGNTPMETHGNPGQAYLIWTAVIPVHFFNGNSSGISPDGVSINIGWLQKLMN